MSVRGMQGVSAHIEYIKPKSKKQKIECREEYSKICQYNKSEHYLKKCVENRCKYYGYLFEDKAKETLKDKSKDKLKDKPKEKLKDKPKEKLKDKSSGRNIDRTTHPYLYKNIILISLKTKNEIKIKIVKDSEEIPFEGLYSQSSEVGKLLLYKNINDVVSIRYLNDEFKYRIKEIK